MANFYDKDYVPSSVEDLYQSGWREYMLYNIRKYSLNDVNHSPEDLLQDMMVQLVSTGYLEKFNPDVSEFTVYLHTFIHNFMSKPYNREHKSKNGHNIVNSVGLVNTVEEVDLAGDGSVVSYESLTGDSGDYTDYLCLIQSLESDLAEIKTDSQVEYNGKMIKRDPLTVYRLLRAGYEIKEIAEIFGTSKQFVYTLRKKIFGVVASYV